MGLFGPKLIIPASTGNMTGTSVITSQVVDWRNTRAGSFQVIWTGTPTGTFSIEGCLDFSLDPGGDPDSPGTWEDLGIGIGSPSGSPGSDIADLSITGIPFFRLIYTNISGTGTLTAYAHGKGR
jgi:hypothetical protein